MSKNGKSAMDLIEATLKMGYPPVVLAYEIGRIIGTADAQFDIGQMPADDMLQLNRTAKYALGFWKYALGF